MMLHCKAPGAPLLRHCKIWCRRHRLAVYTNPCRLPTKLCSLTKLLCHSAQAVQHSLGRLRPSVAPVRDLVGVPLLLPMALIR